MTNKLPNTTKVLVKMREDRGLSYANVGDIMDCSRAYVYKVEKGFFEDCYKYLNKIVKKVHATKAEAEALKKAWIADKVNLLEF